MSSALAIAAVTAVLKHLLENGLTKRGVTANIGGDVALSALPPDRITTGADERAQLNLFLWNIAPHTGLRRTERASTPTSDDHRPAPLALDLYYLLSAYGAIDFQAEVLLGYAIELFDELSTIQGDVVQMVLRTFATVDDGATTIPFFAALASAEFGDRIEQLTLKPQFLAMDELAKIWSVTQAHYRPSVTYKISLLLTDIRS